MAHHLNTNKQFMKGTMIMAFAVIVIVVLFLYMSMRTDWDPNKPKTYSTQYEICLSQGFANDSIIVMMGDSTLFSGFVANEPMVINVQRFEENTTLMFVDPRTETVSIVDLSKDGGKFDVGRQGSSVKLLTKPSAK